jgi:cyclic pyranopterin phosphate synthase
MSHPALTDRYGRTMRKLRISLLDACNMRCVYCMPDDPVFSPQRDWIVAEEIVQIASHLVGMGLEEIRLTGGEPTLRPDLVAIAQSLSALPLQKLGLTSNGLVLERLLPALKATQCKHLNISLDSLDRGNFTRITQRDALPAVLRTLLTARDLGFSVKVNVVMLRGLNDHELLDFIDWSGREAIPVRFLEAMNIGVMQPQFTARLLPAEAMLATIRSFYHLTPLHDAPDATAFRFRADNGADIGFIASESKPFCGDCSRLRLTANGHLRPCLFTEQGIDMRGLAPQHYPAALASLLELKPAGRIAHVAQPMYQIGG